MEGFAEPDTVRAWEIKLGDRVLYDGAWHELTATSRSTGQRKSLHLLLASRSRRTRRLAVRPDDLMCRAARLNRTADELDQVLCLPPQKMIRHAEQLIRARYRVLSDGYPFWGKIADDLNDAANIPHHEGNRTSDWRRFNRAQGIAAAVIEMFLGTS